MKILVNTVTGKKIEVDITQMKTVDELKSYLLSSENLPNDSSILFGDKKMSAGTMLSSYNIKDGSELVLVVAMRGGQDDVVRVVKKTKCNAGNCNDKISKIVGECK